MIQGMRLEVRNVVTLKKQMSMEISMMGNLMQKQVVNDSIGYNEIQGKKIPMGKEDIYKIIGEENILFPEFNVNTDNIELKSQFLSGGNLQKLIIGRELITSPDLLICFNPTWGLDVGAINYIHETLIKINEQNTKNYQKKNLGKD